MDNINVTPSGPTPMATEDFGATRGHVQVVKLAHGNRDVDDGNVSKTNPLPTSEFYTVARITRIHVGTGSFDPLFGFPLANRRAVLVQNLGDTNPGSLLLTHDPQDGSVFFGFSPGDNAFEIKPGGPPLSLPIGPGVAFYLVSNQPNAAQDVRITEMA